MTSATFDPPAGGHSAHPLAGHIAVVTGASRGVGKGVALALGSAGATVYVTGRSVRGGATPLAGSAAPVEIGGTIDDTADAVTARGGRGIAVRCDHADDDQIRALFDRVKAEAGAIDILVNNAFAIPDGELQAPFWELPLHQWDTMHRVGLRSHYVTTHVAAPLLFAAAERREAAGSAPPRLVANISSFGAKVYAVNVPYGAGKAALDRLSRDMGRELAPRGVAAVSLWPGIVKTERLLLEPERLGFDPTNGESPELTGRAVVALATDPKLLERTGQALVVAELASEYGFSDIDGSQPRSLRVKRPA